MTTSPRNWARPRGGPVARYRLSEKDRAFAAEFLETPVGYHSPGLQRVLNLLRCKGPNGKYVLIVLEPYRRWGVGRLAGPRGAEIERLHEMEFTDLDEAERAVFRLRWREETGEELDL